MSDSRTVFISSNSASETCFAIPRTVCLATVSVSSLKFSSITYAVLVDRVTVSLRCDVCCEDWRVLGSTRESVRAGKIPSIGIWAGFMHTKGG